MAELRHHLPYSIVSVVASMVIMGVLTYAVKAPRLEPLFHVFHPAHLLLATSTTTAMFWIHDRNWSKAVLIGMLCPAPLCTLSDIVIPYLGGVLLDRQMELHICLIEEPLIIVPFVVVGAIAGIAAGEYVHRSTVYSHAGHVSVSSMASMLYLLGYGVGEWSQWVGAILLILLAAVMVPCCTSDIVLPLLFVKGRRCEHARDLDEI